MLQRLVGVLAVAAVLVGVLLYSQWQEEPLRVSGYVEADEIRIGSRVGGRVQAVFVEEGDKVEAGARLVELEPFDLRERLLEAAKVLQQRQARYDLLAAGYRKQEIAQAEARVQQLQAQLAELEHGPREQEIVAAQAELELAQEELQLATQKWERVRGLLARGAATPSDREEAETALEVARRRVEVESQQLDLLKEGTRPEQIDAARAQLREAEAQLDLRREGHREEEIAEAYAARDAARAEREAIAQQIRELEVLAPVDGRIEALELQKGDLVPANAPVLTMIDTGRLWVRAYVPEDELDLAIGDVVAVTVDSFPDRAFRGRIGFVSRQAEFTPRNVQTPEERSKQVFRIKVMLEEGLDVLRPGMAADVWLEGLETRP